MRLPLKITATGGVTLSPQAEQQIREKAEGLERHCDQITSCRVTVSAPARHHQKGAFDVRIDLTLPGVELVVNRQEDEELPVAIRESFAAAKRQVEDHMHRLRGEVKTHGTHQP